MKNKMMPPGEVQMTFAERVLMDSLHHALPTVMGLHVRGEQVFVLHSNGTTERYRASPDFKRMHALLCAAEGDPDWQAALLKQLPSLEPALLPWADADV
jgi:hypothetical protein